MDTEQARERMAAAYDDPDATAAQQAESVSDLIQARITAAGLDDVASRAEPEDPQAADDWAPDTSGGLPAEAGSAIGDALPWLEAREAEAGA